MQQYQWGNKEAFHRVWYRLAALNAAAQADDTPPSAPRKVVSARFGGPLSVQEPAPEADDSLSAVIEEFDRANGFDPRRVLSGL
jgi:hypothetical protein